MTGEDSGHDGSDSAETRSADSVHVVGPATSGFTGGNFVSTPGPVYTNIGSNTIIVTEDKVRIALTNHAQRLGARGRWIPPLSILVTLVAVFVSANFKSLLGVEAAVVQAVFATAALLVLGWLLWALAQRALLGKIDAVNEIIQELRGE